MVEYVINTEANGSTLNLVASMTREQGEQLSEKVKSANQQQVANGKRVALVHKSARVDSKDEEEEDLDTAQDRVNRELAGLRDCDLVILFVKGAGPARDYKGRPMPPGKKCWICGTEFLIEHFDKLHHFLHETHAKEWAIEGWLPRCPEELVAWYLVQVALDKINGDGSNDELKSIGDSLRSEAERQFDESPYRTQGDRFHKETVERMFRQMAAS